MRVSGRFDVWVHDAKTGALLQHIEKSNIVTDVGFQILSDILASATSDGLNYLAVGTSSTAAAAGDTTLGAEVWRGSVVSKARSGNNLVITGFLDTGSANGSTIAEAGLFTASSSGRMFNRSVLSPSFAKDATKTATIQVTITWSR